MTAVGKYMLCNIVTVLREVGLHLGSSDAGLVKAGDSPITSELGQHLQ